MTTYTLTQDQLDLLTGVLERAGTTDDSEYKWDTHSKAKKMLRDLQPNTQHIKEVVVHADYREMWRKTLRLNQQLCAQLSAPQAKPLTDKQIFEIGNEADADRHVSDWYGMLNRFARAIEAAHNIKGK